MHLMRWDRGLLRAQKYLRRVKKHGLLVSVSVIYRLQSHRVLQTFRLERLVSCCDAADFTFEVTTLGIASRKEPLA
jgi:hypothetical protein